MGCAEGSEAQASSADSVSRRCRDARLPVIAMLLAVDIFLLIEYGYFEGIVFDFVGLMSVIVGTYLKRRAGNTMGALAQMVLPSRTASRSDRRQLPESSVQSCRISRGTRRSRTRRARHLRRKSPPMCSQPVRVSPTRRRTCGR